MVGLGIVGLTVAFLVDTYLAFGLGWPGGASPLGGEAKILGWLQLALYPASILGVVLFVLRDSHNTLRTDARRLSKLCRFVIRAAFWVVLIVGLADMIISFVRVEGFLPFIVSEEMAKRVGISNWRGHYVHFPLMALSLVIALRSRSLGFTWLALLVVVAEFGIVLGRFVFSYERAFMGDLVRFWYAALFLFASAETLAEEGHVRVDVLNAGFSDRRKAWTNCIGSLVLGIPLCVVILSLGLADKASIIASPILAFETTQSGFGLYVKYLMAGFLGVFAFSMLVQFSAYFLDAAAELHGKPAAIPKRTESPAH